MKVIGDLNIENKLHVGNLNVPTFNMEVDGGDNEIHAKFYGNYNGNQGILVERTGGDNVKLLAGYTGYGGGLESKSALRFSVGGNNLSTPAVHITESSVVNISEYIKFPYVNSTNTPTPNIPNVATQKRAIWMDMEGDESYLEYGHVDAGQTYTQFRVTDNNSGDRFRIYIDDWEKVEKDRIPLDVRGDRVLLCQDGGNVGIGLTDPDNKLSVKRTLGIMNPDWDNGAAVGSRLLIGLNSTSGDDFSYIQAQDGGGTSNNNLILQRYGGNVGIGTTSPDSKLHVEGQVKIVDGSEGADKVLTSDASGLASWEDLSSMVGGLVSDTNTHVVSGVITTTLQDPAFTKGPYVTHLILTKNDGTEVSIDITDLKDDWQTHNLLFNSNTNILTLYSYNLNDGTGAPRKENSVDLSPLVAGLAADTNNYVTTGKLVGNILTLERNGGLSDITVDMAQFIDNVDTNTYVIGGSVVKGAVACDHKIRLELNNGSFIAGAIDVSSLSSDNYVSDLTLVGSQLTLKQSNECGNEKPTFQVDLSSLTSGLSAGVDNDWTIVGNNMYSNPSGDVGIGTDTPTSKLHILDTSPDGGDGTYTLLNLEHSFGDLGQQKVLIDFTLRDTNSNGVPQVRIGAEVGTNGDANSMPKEGSGAFVVHTGLGDSDTTNVMTEKLRVSANGNVGIGTSTPDSKLHIDGQIKITGGNPGTDKVLTSDGDGLATWKNHSGASNVGFFEIGMILPFAGNVLPVGWIECNGKVWWQDNYPDLYGVIGNAYNKGNSYPNQFLVPDLRGRSIVGYDQNGSFQDVNGVTIFDDIGDRGGEIGVKLDPSDVPHKPHSHEMDIDAVNAHSGFQDSAHWHTLGTFHTAQHSSTNVDHKTGDPEHKMVINGHTSKDINWYGDPGGTGRVDAYCQPELYHHSQIHGPENKPHYGGQREVPITGRYTNNIDIVSAGMPDPDGAHTHTLDPGTSTSGGNDVAEYHNNLPPYLTMKYMIYAGTFTPHATSGGGTSG